MACWVAPVVAAELWGVSLNHVLVAIADGTLPSQREYGFTLVDVAPHAALCQTSRRPGHPPPPTYILVEELTPEQVPGDPPAGAPAAVPVAPAVEPAATDQGDWSELPPLDEEEDDVPITHWREARARVGRSRQAPRRVVPRAA